MFSNLSTSKSQCFNVAVLKNVTNSVDTQYNKDDDNEGNNFIVIECNSQNSASLHLKITGKSVRFVTESILYFH